MSFRRKHANIVNFANDRQINSKICYEFRTKLHVTDSFIKRIDLYHALSGHEGCVNCLEWNESGRLLLSASDDMKVILWDPFAKKSLRVFPTLHNGNIFSAKFLPKSGDSKIATAAADCKLLCMDTETGENTYSCFCAGNRVKRLATAPDQPFVFWSASEDGCVRESDIRVPHTCSRTSSNVLVNLRNHSLGNAEIKCVAVNPVFTDLLAVGANDPYVRLYDRRLIKLCNIEVSQKWCRSTPTKSPDVPSFDEIAEPWINTDNLVGGCVDYFVPGHLHVGFQERDRHASTTYVSFSSNGRDILCNIGNEQIYLFDTMKKRKSEFIVIPTFEPETEVDTIGDNNNGTNVETETLPESVEALRCSANQHYQRGEFLAAIRFYNLAIAEYSRSSVLYCNRAQAYLKRAWKGDTYAALRDCRRALELSPNYIKAYFRMARCLFELGQFKEAKKCIDWFGQKFVKHSTSSAFRALIKDIDDGLEVAAKEKKKREQRRTRANNNMNGFVEMQVIRDGIEFAPILLGLSLSKAEDMWRNQSSDFEHRYYGHSNTMTDIKEVNFFGKENRYIVAGSDCGSIFFWDRKTENYIQVLKGDKAIVNSLQPHPEFCFLASSGLDPVVRIWCPMDPSNFSKHRLLSPMDYFADLNSQRLDRSHDVYTYLFSHNDSTTTTGICRPS